MLDSMKWLVLLYCFIFVVLDYFRRVKNSDKLYWGIIFVLYWNIFYGFNNKINVIWKKKKRKIRENIYKIYIGIYFKICIVYVIIG